VRGGADTQPRPAWIYTPAECTDAREPCAVVVALGSGAYAETIPIDRIIDHLVDIGRMRPALVAAIDVEEWSDRRSYEPTADWVADTLLPWLRERFAVSGRREHVVVAGTSRRGLVATSIAFRRSDAVGAAIAMSGSFYWSPPGAGEPEWLARLVAAAPPRDVRLVLAVGSFETVVTETNRGHYPLATTRHMRDVLLARDYDVRYAEYAGVHSELNWQDALADGLVQLLPADPARAKSSHRR
jgi:enterochelin esterase family protein